MGRFYERCGPLMMLLIFEWVGALVLAMPSQLTASPTTKYFHFNIEWKNVSRLCHTKPLLTVNGEYPGPTIAVREGDHVRVKVTNHVPYNTTIHWHGIRQLRSGWADGPAYITQCPIQSNQSYTYRFQVTKQRGTLLWHAHFSWQRVSIHGAFIIYPSTPYPFSTPIHAEIPIILGEWWNEDVEGIVGDIIMYGGGPNASQAYTINGLPGPLYPCSLTDTFRQTVEHGKTYMLRIINAALNNELFFAIANHTLTVVEIDAAYVKPFVTTAIMIAPGQTTNVLLTANHGSEASSFTIAATPYVTAVIPFNNSTTIGFVNYIKTSNTSISQPSYLLPIDPQDIIKPPNLPPMRDSAFATKFSKKLRSLATTQFPCKVPKKVDKRLVITIGLNLQDCPPNATCKGFLDKRFSASMNNQSFVHPLISLLQLHYRNYTSGLFSTDFPENPPHRFDFVSPTTLDTNMNSEFGTKLLQVSYGTHLEFVLQDTSFVNVENHPIHIHGYNFFIVGSGFGNFDRERDPKTFNLVDPPERNTVAVPSGGWAAIRFKADNPGVWFMHCHLEVHTEWGLSMAFIVDKGPNSSQCIYPPPKDFPLC